MKNTINSLNKMSNVNNRFDSPEDRVIAFIAHWHEQWLKAREKMGTKVDFDYWGNLISEVDELHFVTGRSSGTSDSFNSKANYDPINEKITECEVEGEIAQVFTELYKEAINSSTYHVYELMRDAESGWKITEVFTLFHPPKSSVINVDQHAEILAMSIEDAPLIDRQDNIDLNENKLFGKERKINIPHLDEVVTRLEQIGNLRISSGVIGILDFGYDIYDFEPLHRKVRPGEYPVEVVTIHDRVAGIRVKFTDSEEPIKWYAANTPSGNGVYDVDAGNLAIFDVSKLLGLNRIKKEKIFNEWSESGKPEIVSMTGTNDCVISTSGFGDGAYPAYWGVNKQDEVLSLYIDFMILVNENENGLYESI